MRARPDREFFPLVDDDCPSSPVAARVSPLLPIGLGAASLLPFLVHYRQFAGLFWFGDEIGLLNEVDTMRFTHWLWYPFVESVLPLFKLIWGGMIFAGGGSYLVMLWFAWIVHSLVAGGFAVWLRRSGFSAWSTALAVLVFAWAGSNIETLTWTVQSSSQLADLFFILAMCVLSGTERPEMTPGRIAWLVLWSAASAASFCRGLVTGPVAACVLVSWRECGRRERRMLAAALAVVPAIVIGILMLRSASVNTEHISADTGHWTAVLKFAGIYLAGNPGLQYWCATQRVNAFALGPAAVIATGAGKWLLVLLGWRWSKSPAQRRLLASVLLFDVGYAALLGLGRSNGSAIYALSSRYQYTSLLCTLPFVAVVFDRLFLGGRWPRRSARALAVAVIVLTAGYGELGWRAQLPGWVDWRGATDRRLLLGSGPVPDRSGDVVALPTFPDRRAKQLVDKYHLH